MSLTLKPLANPEILKMSLSPTNSCNSIYIFDGNAFEPFISAWCFAIFLEDHFLN